MIQVEIRDIDRRLLSLGDKVQIIDDLNNGIDAIYEVKLVKNKNALMIRAVKIDDDSAYINLGGELQPDVKLYEFAESSNFFKEISGKKMYLVATQYDCSIRSKELIQELRNLKFKGVCVVDMFLVTGGESSRYWEIEFDGTDFSSGAFNISGSSKLTKIEKKLYKEHPELIYNSILCWDQKIKLMENLGLPWTYKDEK